MLLAAVLSVAALASVLNADDKLKDVYNIVVLGNTGVGKSALLNMFAGQDVFTVGDAAMSETQIASSRVINFLGKADAIKLRLIDTQGLSDSGGDVKDMENIKNMVEYVKNLGEIDLFLMCFDGQNPRFTSYAQATISLFRQIFPDFLYHSVLVFNKWTSPSADKLNALKKEYQDKFRHDYELANIPCYFIDSYYNRAMLRDNDDGTQSVRQLHPKIQERTNAQIVEFVGYLILKDTVCDVRRIQPKNTEKTQLIKDKEAAMSELERTRLENSENAKRMEETFHKTLAQMNADHAANIARIQAEARQRRKKNIWQKIASFFG